MTIEFPDKLGAPLIRILEREAIRLRERRTHPGIPAGDVFDEIEVARVVADATWKALKERAAAPEFHVQPQGGVDLTGGLG